MIFPPNSNHSYHSARIQAEYMGEGKVLCWKAHAWHQVSSPFLSESFHFWVHHFHKTLTMMQLMSQGSLPVYLWQELKVSRHSYLSISILMFFCSMQVPPEIPQSCTPNKPVGPPESYLPISIQPMASLWPLDQDIFLSTIFNDKVSVFHLAIAMYYAPSDPSGMYDHQQNTFWLLSTFIYDIWWYLVLLDYTSVFVIYFLKVWASDSKCEKANENMKKKKKVPCHKESLRRN